MSTRTLAIYSLPRPGETPRQLGYAHQEQDAILVILDRLPLTNGFAIIGPNLRIEVAVLPPACTLGHATASMIRSPHERPLPPTGNNP
jgi:hypothetical protein